MFDKFGLKGTEKLDIFFSEKILQMENSKKLVVEISRQNANLSELKQDGNGGKSCRC